MWVFCSLFVMISSAIVVLISKYLTSVSEHPDYCLFMVFVVCGVIAGLILLLKYQHNMRETVLQPKLKLAIVSMAMLIILDWWLFNMAIDKAPNPGLAHCIVNLNVISVLFVSAIMFDSKLTKKSLIGAVVCVIGVSLLVNI